MTLLLLLKNSSEGVPVVETDIASNINLTTATLNGIIASVLPNATVRGFQYNTTPYPDRDVNEVGSFSDGAFGLNISGLTPGQTYFYRAYATNSYGTVYGDWFSFNALASDYSVQIDGIDRTLDILNGTLTIQDNLTDQQNTCAFSFIDRSGNGIPATDSEIIITSRDGDRIFGGYLLNVKKSTTGSGAVKAQISCVDYVRLLDSNLVHQTYTGMTDAEIIQDILDTYCTGLGITGINVIEGVTIDQITFNYIQPSQALRKIADLTGRNWYIDYNKDIHYFPLTTSAAPFNITDAVITDYSKLNISSDASQLKNRVYVRGGTKLSDPTTFSQKGDGTQRKFPLPDKPHDVSITVNGVSKTLGIKNIDAAGSFQWFVNFEEKYVEQDASQPVLSSTDVLVVTYSYDIPILVAVEDTASIAANGQKEFAIFDKTISTQQAGRDRASAELTDYANNLIEGSFRTFTNGFRSGQYITINLGAYGISGQYIVQRVQAFAFGAGNYYYEVGIASAKTMGVIRFLIELLEANGKLVAVGDSEVVDNLLSIADSLNADSLQDSLTIDSAGAYATWCTDSTQLSPSTRARWDLFQWG